MKINRTITLQLLVFFLGFQVLRADKLTAPDMEVSTDEGTPVTITVIADDDDDEGKDKGKGKKKGQEIHLDGFSTPANGTVIDNEDGTLTYTPSTGFYGVDSFTYTLRKDQGQDDGDQGNTATGTITVTVSGTNDAPMVADIPNQTIDEGGSFAAIALDEYVDDLDNTDSEITWTYGGNGALTVSIDGSRIATIGIPDAQWSGSEAITFTATDPTGLSDSDPATFTVGAVNDAPVVADITDQTIDEGGSFATIALDEYVSDPDNSDSEITWTYGGNRALTVSIDGSRIATIGIPDAQWSGSEAITFTATDPSGLSDSDPATFTVGAVNDAPVAVADAFSVSEDSPVGTLDVLANDIDVDGDDLIITNFRQANGKLHIINGGKHLSYEPTPNFSGDDIFLYTIRDAEGVEDEAQVTVTVGGVNDAPVVADIPNQTIDEGGSFATIALDEYVDDLDNTDSEITWTYGGNGALTVSIDGSRIATIGIPDAEWSGSEAITFTATDPSGLSDSDPATFTVGAVNDAPVVADIPNQTIGEGGSFATIALDEYVSDLDNADSEITWTYGGNSALTVSINGSRIATIGIPDAEWSGSEAITFTATDPSDLSDSDPATFTVSAVNDAPVAVADAFSVSEDSPVSTLDVLANDIDVDGDDLIITNFRQANGVLHIIDGGKSLSYEPTPNFSGDDIFFYTIRDAEGVEDEAQVTVTVEAVNDDPVITSATSADATEDVPFSYTATATDADGDDLTFSFTGLPGWLSADGATVSGTPGEGDGDATFTIHVSDGQGGSASAGVSVTVEAVNDDPVALDDQATTGDGAPVTIPVLANDDDIDGNDLSITSVDMAAHGETEIFGDAIVYTPEDDFSGADIFDYTISDGQGGSASATVTVLVDLGDETVNEEVGPEGGEVSTGLGTSINIPAGALDDTVTIIIGEFAASPEGPELAGVLYFYGPTGLQFNMPVAVTVPYNPDVIPDGSSPADLVLLIYNEGTGEWSVADSNEVNEVALTLTGWITHFSGFAAGLTANQSPYSLMSLPDLQISEDTYIDTLIPDLGEYFTDRDGDQLTFAATTADAGLEGFFGLSEQKLIVVLTPNYYGTVNIEVTATDPAGASVQETLVLEILPVNDAPQFIALIPDLFIPEDVIAQISLADIAAAVVDVDGDALSFSAVSDTSAVTVAMGDTSMAFSPAANWNGKAQIVVTVMDGQATAQDTFTLTILPVNDLPTGFELVGPASGSSLVIQADDPDTSILFTWEPSSDPDGDAITYIFALWQEDSEFEITQPVTEPELHLLRELVVTFMLDNGVERETFRWEVGAVSGSDTTWNTDGPSSLEIDLSTLAVVDDSHLPQLFALHQNYPNPFNPVTTVHYELPMQSHVRLVIYDMRGREVIRLVERYESAGFKKVSWNSSDHMGRPVPTGIYFARLVTADYTHTIKMTLIR